MRDVAKQANEERLNVRIPAALMEDIKDAAERSGWGVSDQIRFELLQLRGKWQPYLPTKQTPAGSAAG